MLLVTSGGWQCNYGSDAGRKESVLYTTFAIHLLNPSSLSLSTTSLGLAIIQMSTLLAYYIMPSSIFWAKTLKRNLAPIVNKICRLQIEIYPEIKFNQSMGIPTSILNSLI